MQKVFEKIKERLERSSWWTQATFDCDGYSNDDSEEVITLDKAIEIAKELSGVSQKSTVELVSILNEKAFVTKSPKIYLSEILGEYDLFKVWALDLNILDMSIEK